MLKLAAKSFKATAIILYVQVLKWEHGHSEWTDGEYQQRKLKLYNKVKY